MPLDGFRSPFFHFEKLHRDDKLRLQWKWQKNEAELQINYAIYIKMITSILIKPGNARKKHESNQQKYLRVSLVALFFALYMFCCAFFFGAK